MVYVYDYKANAVLGFSTTSTGNATPTTAIKGSATTMDASNAFGLAFDGSGSLYTIGSNLATAAIFPTGATGNVPPTASLTNSNGAIYGLSFDGSGHAFMTTTPLGSGSYQNPQSTIEIFAPGATGSPAPIGSIAISETGYASAGNSVVDSNGTLYVINQASVLIYKNAANAKGTVYPTTTLTGTDTMLTSPVALTVDNFGNLIVADAKSGILFFGDDLEDPTARYPEGDQAPYAIIAGNNTKIGTPSGIAVDGSNNVWESDAGSIPELLEFPYNSYGNITPMTQITGSATMLQDPTDIVFVPGGDVTQSAKRRIPSIAAARRFGKNVRLQQQHR
jgi:hypothetical protein